MLLDLEAKKKEAYKKAQSAVAKTLKDDVSVEESDAAFEALSDAVQLMKLGTSISKSTNEITSAIMTNLHFLKKCIKSYDDLIHILYEI